jgi:putative membrane protein
MKKILLVIILIFALSFIFPILSFAEITDNHTVREEAEGKEIWEKLQKNELKCGDLTDRNFGTLGEYFMGQMTGDSHEVMNNMIVQMMGEEGEEQMHVAMGKRMSNCEPNAPMPQNMPPMMKYMMSGWSNSSGVNNFNFKNPMMWNFSNNPMGWFGFGWIFMILFWILVIVGLIALIKWLVNQNKKEKGEKSALDILKERYARGEIDKKEFEERKKDLI